MIVRWSAEEWLMHKTLSKLMRRMPAPESPRHAQVDRPLLEEHIGLQYPASFKEFVGIYGACHWFDKLLPLYACPTSPKDAKAFVKDIGNQLKWLTGNLYDERFREIVLPQYPARGGLFPFMNDVDGPK